MLVAVAQVGAWATEDDQRHWNIGNSEADQDQDHLAESSWASGWFERCSQEGYSQRRWSRLGFEKGLLLLLLSWEDWRCSCAWNRSRDSSVESS